MLDYYQVITISIGIIATIIIPLWLGLKRQDISFKLKRNNSHVDKPIKSNIALIISNPEKTIKKCRLIYKGKALRSDENAKIVVKNGRHTLEKFVLKRS